MSKGWKEIKEKIREVTATQVKTMGRRLEKVREELREREEMERRKKENG